MGVKVKYKVNKDDFPGMKKRLDSINGTSVEVGVLNGEHAWLAGIHEYGCDIPVTDKMRGWLGAHGLHLNKKTAHIHIPARPFLAPGYDKHRDEVMEHAKMILADVAAGKTSADACYSAVGMHLASKIKEYAIDLNSPGKHPFTLAQGGGSNPLVQTGDMIGGINWRRAK